MIFKKLFQGYVFPFKRADVKIAEMKDAEQIEYFRQAKEMLENRVYQLEIEELIRTYYQELAIKAVGKDEQMAIRKTLTAIQMLDSRIRGHAARYLPPKAKDSFNKL